MSHFPPPAAEDVIYREGRRRPRWVPLAGAAAVVVALGVVGVVAFGGDDGSAAQDPWTLLRADPASGAVDAVGADGATATFDALGTLPGVGTGPTSPVDTTSSLVATVADSGVVTVLDAATGEIRTIATGTDLGVPTRAGDVLVAVDTTGASTLVDLRAGTTRPLRDVFGLPSDVALYAASAARDGAVLVIGNGGAGVVLSTAPSMARWFDGTVYDATANRVLAGSVGSDRTMSLYVDDAQVGEPVSVDGRVRARLVDGKDVAVVLQEDGTILRVDFAAGTSTTTGRLPSSVLGDLADGELSAYLVGDERMMVELADGWALVGVDGALVARFTPGGIEPGATRLDPRWFGTECMVMAVGGNVPDRSALVNLDSGEVVIDVAGSAVAPPSEDGCSFHTTGTTQILIVDGAVVDVAGDLLAVSPDHTEVIVRATDGGAVVDRMVTRYRVVKGALADPLELGAGAYLYLFVPKQPAAGG